MALPPLPADTTGRLIVRYSNGIGTHTMQFRQRTDRTPEQLTLGARGFLAVAAQLLPSNGLFLSADYIPPGTNIGNPVQWTPIVGLAPAFTDAAQDPQNVSWVGRSTTGRKTRITLFTPYSAPPADNYRWEPGDSPGVDAALTFLQEVDLAFGAIDGSFVIWKSYANASYNAYWQRQRRKV